MTWAIELHKLTKSFGSKVAVDNLSLQVPAGTIFGFLGPNGAGKTTTIKMMVGLMRPDSGSGKILGCDMVSSSVPVRERTGYVSEMPQLYGYMTVNEILAFSKAFYKGWNDTLVRKYLEFFGLPKQQRIKNLSKGMKTQLALIIAMAPEPELLILDEPTSGLDAINRQEFLNVILEEISLQGRTVFFSSHILHDVERVADQVAIIKDGKLLDIRVMDELKTTVKKIRVVFLREPDAELFAMRGIKNVAREGSSYLISVENNLQEILERLRANPYLALDIIDQNLEEIFIEKVRGPVK